MFSSIVEIQWKLNHLSQQLRTIFTILSIVAILGQAAELPPEREIDRLLVQAERQLRGGEFARAAAGLDRARSIGKTHHSPVPAVAWVMSAEALPGAGVFADAEKAAVAYLEQAGKSGEHYREVLELLDEIAQEAEREEEAKAIVAVAEPLHRLTDDFTCPVRSVIDDSTFQYRTDLSIHSDGACRLLMTRRG